MSLVLEDHSHPLVTILSLNRPDKRNALNMNLMDALVEAIKRISPEKRVLILKGEGPVFCSGLDLVEAADQSLSQKSATRLGQVLKAVSETPLVTIVLVSGAAVAGGAGLMAACDYVIAEPQAQFGFPEVRRGMVAAQISPFLKRQLKDRDLRELLLLGELIDAKKAREIGLISQVMEKECFLQEALRIASFVNQAAPNAIAATKQLLSQSQLTEDYLHEVHLKSRGSAEAKEGIAAFLEHRKPCWTN